MYAYLIYRQAIEWAFETLNVPIIKLSPWPYEYNAAFIVRHDFENYQNSIRSIEDSALYEHNLGVKGDYYFCTGTLREEMIVDQDEVIVSLRSAVTNYGASIGSHNGGLENPRANLSMGDFQYWHWGPDEALDVTPPGYASGNEYAKQSISFSFEDIEDWLAGVDNGRAGCGSAGDCPRLWAAPYYNSTREGSYQILEELGTLSSGEQKISPFPHWTLSYEISGKRYAQVSIPASDWYVGTTIPKAIEVNHSPASIQAAVDFYYDHGFMINLYSHQVSSASTLIGEYAAYCVAKNRMWSANSVEIADWWQLRSSAVVAPSYSVIGDTTASAQATISGGTDPDTAIEVVVPNGNASNLQVLINNAPADPADYRIVGNAIRVRVGASPSSAKVQYTITTTTSTVQPTTTTSTVQPTTTTSTVQPTTTTSTVVMNDFDNDGNPDILWRDTSSGWNLIWQMNGYTPTGTTWWLPTVDTSWQVQGTADFDNDGNPDILWRDTSSGWNLIWQMNGYTPTGTTWWLPTVDTSWQVQGTADFDNDGNPDILWRDTSSGWNLIWQMNGYTPTGTTWWLPTVDTSWQVQGTADFDNDGNPDILWRDTSSGWNLIWQMNGYTPTGTTWWLPTVDTSWQVQGTADFDNDGNPDILWRDTSSGWNLIWQMNGYTPTGTTWWLPTVDIAWTIASE